MFVRNTIVALVATAGLTLAAGCAPARPVVVEHEEYDPYYGYHTVVVEEAPPPVVVVGPVYGGYGYGPRGHWR